MSAVRMLHGRDARASTEHCVRVEDQPAVWDEALRLGQMLGDRVRNGEIGSATSLPNNIPLWRIPSLLAMMIRTRRWTAAARRHRNR